MVKIYLKVKFLTKEVAHGADHVCEVYRYTLALA